MRVLVTGATGFVGRTLVPMLLEAGHDVVAATRSQQSLPFPSVVTGEIGPTTEWSAALKDVDAIIHLAARAHKINDADPEPEKAFMETNARGTQNLLEQADGKRFVFFSTIGVHGNASNGVPITEDSPLQPHDPYSRSKLVAEEAVKASGNFTIIRPPLIYGEGAPGNLDWLCRMIARGKVPPVGNACGRRSMISVRNIGSLTVRILEDELAVNQTFVIADDRPFVTHELIRALAAEMAVPLKLRSIPTPLMKTAATLLGRRATFDKLYGDLVVDSSKLAQTLTWQPPFDPAEDLAMMARAYAKS